MQGPQEFGVRVDGKYPSELDQYRNLIYVDRYDSERQKKGDRRIKYRKSQLEEEYENGEVPLLAEDLINISLATFAADRLIKRDVKLNMKRSEDRYYSRKIQIHIPVSNKPLWNEVREDLNELVSFMTYDLVEYNFLTRRTEDVEYEPNESEFDSVSMFSGGLDSLGGSYYLRDEENLSPRFLCVNHSRLGSILDNITEVVDVEPLRINLDEEGIEGVEDTQFSRSLMYLSFGVAVALAHNVEKVFIPENGVIARQIGLDEGRLTTRTVHPKVLRLFNDILATVFSDRPITVINPFTHSTKTEVVNHIGDEEAIRRSISCAHTRFLPKKYSDHEETHPAHCGMGMPCLLRIISIMSSEVSSPEDILNVYHNPFMTNFEDIRYTENLELPENDTQASQLKNHYRDSLVNIMDLLKMAVEVNRSSESEMYARYSGLNSPEVYKMYQRFSDEILDTAQHYEELNPTLKKAVNRVS